MNYTLNSNLSAGYAGGYQIKSNLNNKFFENLAERAAAKFGMTAAIINFVSSGVERGHQQHRTSNSFVIAFREDASSLMSDDIQSAIQLTNPLLAAERGIRFYATSPVYSEEQLIIGMLCLLDYQTKDFSMKEQFEFDEIAGVVSAEINALRNNSPGNAIGQQ
jgi:GAF domain-containing protein